MIAFLHLQQLSSLGGYTAGRLENFLLGNSSPPSTSDVTVVRDFRFLQFMIFLEPVWRIGSGCEAENRPTMVDTHNPS